MIFKSTKRKAQEELAKRLQRALYQNSPEDWLVNRFGDDIKVLDWEAYGGYEGHKWDGTPNPFKTAFEALANGNWVGIKSATGVGKTYWLPRIIYWYLDTFPNSLVITTAPKKEQLRRVLWTEIANCFPQFKKIRPHAELLTLNLQVDGRSKKLNVNELGGNSENVGHEAIGIVAGVGSGEESATKMQGFHRKNMLFVIDELPGIHPAVLTAIVNTCTDPHNNLICAVGNPDSVLDALSMFCNLNHTVDIRISAYDHPNVVNQKNIIPGAVTKASLDFRRDEYGEDSPFFKSRARGIAPAESSGSVIKAAWFDQCVESSDTFLDIEHNTKDFKNAVGVDVANSERGDMASTAWGLGNMLTLLLEFQCPNANHLAYNLIYDDAELESRGYANYNTPTLADYKIKAKNCGIDGVGVGVATVNSLTDKGYDPTSLTGGQVEAAIAKTDQGELMYSFENLRAQMWFEAREDLRTGQVIIAITDKRKIRQLKKELITPKLIVKNGKIRIESKDEIKKRLGGKSPNLADAFIYWNWVRKGYYDQDEYLPFY